MTVVVAEEYALADRPIRHLALTVAADDHRTLRELGLSSGRPVSALVREAIADYLDKVSTRSAL